MLQRKMKEKDVRKMRLHRRRRKEENEKRTEIKENNKSRRQAD